MKEELGNQASPFSSEYLISQMKSFKGVGVGGSGVKEKATGVWFKNPSV